MLTSISCSSINSHSSNSFPRISLLLNFSKLQIRCLSFRNFAHHFSPQIINDALWQLLSDNLVVSNLLSYVTDDRTAANLAMGHALISPSYYLVLYVFHCIQWVGCYDTYDPSFCCGASSTLINGPPIGCFSLTFKKLYCST